MKVVIQYGDRRETVDLAENEYLIIFSRKLLESAQKGEHHTLSKLLGSTVPEILQRIDAPTIMLKAKEEDGKIVPVGCRGVQVEIGDNVDVVVTGKGAVFGTGVSVDHSTRTAVVLDKSGKPVLTVAVPSSDTELEGMYRLDVSEDEIMTRSARTVKDVIQTEIRNVVEAITEARAQWGADALSSIRPLFERSLEVGTEIEKEVYDSIIRPLIEKNPRAVVLSCPAGASPYRFLTTLYTEYVKRFGNEIKRENIVELLKDPTIKEAFKQTLTTTIARMRIRTEEGVLELGEYVRRVWGANIDKLVHRLADSVYEEIVAGRAVCILEEVENALLDIDSAVSTYLRSGDQTPVFVTYKHGIRLSGLLAIPLAPLLEYRALKLKDIVKLYRDNVANLEKIDAARPIIEKTRSELRRFREPTHTEHREEKVVQPTSIESSRRREEREKVVYQTT